MTDSIHSVWVNPLDFDALENGPPYLPESKNMRLANEHSTVVFTNLVQRFMKGAPMPELGAVLVLLRAASHIHQSHHWQTNGGHFYGDHLLFERLYNESQSFIDQVAERAVGAGHPSLVDPKIQSSLINSLVHIWCGSPGEMGASDMVLVSLETERCVVHCIGEARKAMESAGTLSDGTDNLLQGVADKHEEFIYLLQQRGGGIPVMASYDYRQAFGPDVYKALRTSWDDGYEAGLIEDKHSGHADVEAKSFARSVTEAITRIGQRATTSRPESLRSVAQLLSSWAYNVGKARGEND